MLEQPSNFCMQLATALKGKGIQENESCKIMRKRNLYAAIAGHPMHWINHVIRFETPDYEGNTLITGELVLLENEVSQIVERLSASGIIVSTVHSHWLYDSPKLIYIHFETYSNPMYISRILEPILDDLK